MTSPSEHPDDGLSSALPSDLASAHALILAQRETLAQKEAALSEARSEAKARALEIERLKLQLAGGKWYYIGGADTISQKNFDLISLFLTMMAIPSAVPPLSPVINEGGG